MSKGKGLRGSLAIVQSILDYWFPAAVLDVGIVP
jgi:hypothetical protein